jgi:putative ATP-binding cassette transporter
MTLVELITQETTPDTRRDILIGAAISGLANASLLAVINAASQVAHPSGHLFAMFILAMALYAVFYRDIFQKTTSIFESALYKVRLRVADKIRQAEFQGLEGIGVSEIYDRITENMTVISDSAGVLAACLQAAIMVVCTAFYLASISLPALVLTFLLMAAGVSIYNKQRNQVKEYLRQAAQTRLAFFDALTDLLQGIKEVKFSRQRSDDLYQDIGQIADSLRSSTMKANHLLNDNNLFAQCCFFVLLGTITFLLPQYVPMQGESITSLIAGIFFIMGPLSVVIAGVPTFTRANLAAENIHTLEQKLDADADTRAAAHVENPWSSGRLAKIEARDLEFHYVEGGGQEGFLIGPLSITITSGEILFIVGGNGSGKSTLLKVLTALYPPSAGTLSVDEVCVQAGNVQAYREMISVIYSDSHLFKKLYGLADVETASVNRLLQLMQIERKTSFANQRFTTLELSTGQRKRLALVVALLEDRPIYAFDEWAADQDPEFRRYFYEELIQDLKRRGKTVIVITHDDRYFRCADRVVTMEYGKIRSISVPEAATVTPAPPGAGT